MPTIRYVNCAGARPGIRVKFPTEYAAKNGCYEEIRRGQ
jgi:hypothetical protein